METEAIEAAAKLTEGNAWLDAVIYLGSVSIVCGTAMATVIKLFGKKKAEPDTAISHQQIIDRIDSFENQMTEKFKELRDAYKEFRGEMKEEIRDLKHQD